MRLQFAAYFTLVYFGSCIAAILLSEDLSIGCYTNSSILEVEENHPGITFRRNQFPNTPPSICRSFCKNTEPAAIAGVKDFADTFTCVCGDVYHHDRKAEVLCTEGPGTVSSDRIHLYSVCPRETYGPSCNQSCYCKDQAICSFEEGVCPPGGCKKGWMGRNCGTDINECAVNNGGCIHHCVNTVGGFHCTCLDGYEVQGDTQCQDVNECDNRNGGCEHNCVNTIGGYYCQCNSGYEKGNDTHCFDINECKKDNGGCEHQCINTERGYYCMCNIGFVPLNKTHCKECCKELHSGIYHTSEVSSENHWFTNGSGAAWIAGCLAIVFFIVMVMCAVYIIVLKRKLHRLGV